MNNHRSILVVDDEPQIRKLLRMGLRSFDHNVSVAASGDEALASVASQQPDMVVLDISLDGLEVCRALREASATPILVLTVSDDRETKLAAFNAGADDYVTKPFDMEELKARIRAILRRSAAPPSEAANGEIRVHDLRVDLVKRRVLLKDSEIHLTPNEYKLLIALAVHAGKVLTFAAPLDEINSAADVPKTEHYVSVYVNTLRKKLRGDSASTRQPIYIFSEAGVGYRFADLRPVE